MKNKENIVKQAKELLKKEKDENELKVVKNLLKEKEAAERIVKELDKQLKDYVNGKFEIEDLDNNVYL